MISESDMARVEITDRTGRWYVHNGFFGWSYGSPQDPTPITRSCALRLLNHMAQSRHPTAIELLAAFPYALDYADEGDELFERTGGNRHIAYVSPRDCLFQKAQQSEHDYDA